MNSVRLIKNTKITSRIIHPRYYTIVKNNQQILQCYRSQAGKIGKSPCLKLSLNSIKCISNYNSMQTKDSDPSGGKNDNDKVRKILEDEDIQSILKNFANDFGVDSETNELLDDIRKNIDEDYNNNSQTEKNEENSGALGGGIQKYKEFSDSDSKVIYSYEECNEEAETFYHIDDELKPRTPYIELKRGKTGVFDLHELIEVLRNESLLDITAISVPKELHYTDFLVLATAKSHRHNAAVAESINKLYKQKKHKKDPFLKIEGDNVLNWKAIDMGNIVLHLFLEETRALYDIESLWLLESKYDSGGNAPVDPMLNIIEEQMEFFNSLQQSNSSEELKDPS